MNVCVIEALSEEVRDHPIRSQYRFLGLTNFLYFGSNTVLGFTLNCISEPIQRYSTNYSIFLLHV